MFNPTCSTAKWLAWIGFSTMPPRFERLCAAPAVACTLSCRARAFRNSSHPRDWLDRFRSPSSPRNLIASAGRHSLAFYLIHQPVLIGLVYVLSQLWPRPHRSIRSSFTNRAAKKAASSSRTGWNCASVSAAARWRKLQAENLFDIDDGRQTQRRSADQGWRSGAAVHG